MKLHHIGVVVNRIQDSVGELKNYISFQNISLPIPVVSQKVNVCFLKIGDPALELIEPTSTESPINDFLKKGGEEFIISVLKSAIFIRS